MLALLTIFLLALVGNKVLYAAEFFCSAGDVTCLIAAINEANRNGEDNTIILEGETFTLQTPLPAITGRIHLEGLG
jgi:hypothetical protein